MPEPTYQDNPLSARLRRSAQAIARSALSRLAVDDEQVQGAIDAGTAVEHLAKSFLAKLHPSLLVDRSVDLDTLLHLSGHGGLAKGEAHAVRTVSAHEACQRVARLLPTFRYTERGDQELFVARNAAVHLATTTPAVARKSAKAMVRLVEPLLANLEIDRVAFWGPMLSPADALLDDLADEVQGILKMKYAAAQQRFDQRVRGLSEKERRVVLGALASRVEYRSDLEQGAACPVCGETGTLFCEVEDAGPPQVEYYASGSYEDELESVAWVERVAFPLGFYCSICGLDLEAEEVAAAGWAETFELEPREALPGDFMDYGDDW